MERSMIHMNEIITQHQQEQLKDDQQELEKEEE